MEHSFSVLFPQQKEKGLARSCKPLFSQCSLVDGASATVTDQ
jgi:hypothetical protein